MLGTMRGPKNSTLMIFIITAISDFLGVISSAKVAPFSARFLKTQKEAKPGC